ncbi:TlpA family protein disulfide reductase [Halovivax cerinus]|uniref:TlpA family protein disulfide reductase n=1 Tax=Halovivax cerinus TaxID=1487865 RepID=A0ABD5NTT0_9EURY|nr:thioredoxin family protein [Halovivax cerinus]
MELESLRPNPTWDGASYEYVVETIETHRDELTYRIWAGDWCPDCRSALPDVGAALDAADVPDERIDARPVDRDKDGEGVDEYGIEYIPTIVVETDDGTEVARFVEDEALPPATYLADAIEEWAATA